MESAAGNIHGFYTRHYMLLVSCIFFTFCTGVLGSFVGVNLQYPKGNVDLPKPQHVVDLLETLQVKHVKLQEGFDPSILEAFSGSDTELMLTVPKEHMQLLARSHEEAHKWMEKNVVEHLPSTRVTAVAFKWNLASSDELLEAMRELRFSLETAGLEHDVRVTVSIPVEVFLKEDLDKEELSNILQFLQETDSDLMVDVNPYSSSLSSDLPHEFFTLESTGKPTFFDLAVHSAYAALRNLGYPNVPVTVGSIGWPWKGENPQLASIENAALFTENLVRHALSSSVNVYITEFLDLPGSEGPRYGVFSTSLVPRFRFDISSSTTTEEEIMRRVLADNGTGTSNGTSTGGTTTGGQYCIARTDVPDNLLASGLNWACGQGNADCTAIQQDGPCFLPDNYQSHASYAFNSYYQKNAAAGATCDFNGAATLVSKDPSYNSCIYTSSSTSGTTGNGSGTSSGGIIQPFNPSGNTSSATSTKYIAIATWMVGILLWSCWRFLDV